MKAKSILIFGGGTVFGFTAATVGIPVVCYRFVDEITMRYPEDDPRRIRWVETKTQLRKGWETMKSDTMAAYRGEPKEVKLSVVK